MSFWCLQIDQKTNKFFLRISKLTDLRKSFGSAVWAVSNPYFLILNMDADIRGLGRLHNNFFEKEVPRGQWKYTKSLNPFSLRCFVMIVLVHLPSECARFLHQYYWQQIKGSCVKTRLPMTTLCCVLRQLVKFHVPFDFTNSRVWNIPNCH